MGSGKSCVGRLLASRLGFAFLDTDERIAELCGMSIADLFSTQGEPRFRVLEREVLRDLPRSGAVIALGGGAIASQENRRLLEEHGTLVWLQAAPETLLARIGTAEDRPLLAGLDAGGRLDRLRELLDARNPAYRTAPLRVVTDDRSAGEVCDAIAGALLEQEAPA